MRVGPMEIGLILLIILIVFGAGKLPEVGTAIGKGIREFRKASHGDYDQAKGTEAKPEADEKAVKA
ncbi:MAG: twin-arginine translocase TatA/TatE family subunit [Dehalococcoidia bacterium]|nr:twin-arginine translocase TatA/TatE family subunit [Dehalococcoidia bacterium]